MFVVHDVAVSELPAEERERHRRNSADWAADTQPTSYTHYSHSHQPLVFAAVNNSKVICIFTSSIQGRFAAHSPQIMATNVLYARFMCKSCLL